MTPEEKKELTFGEKAVGITFNIDGDTEVDQIKRACANLIDKLNDIRAKSPDKREEARMLSIAITEIQTAQMWAVKAVTWKY